MQTRSYPTQPATPTPAVPSPSRPCTCSRGIWIASCPTCGFQLTTARTQERCERRASRRTCPICREDP